MLWWTCHVSRSRRRLGRAASSVPAHGAPRHHEGTRPLALARADELRDALSRHGALIDLLKAQLDPLEAQSDLKEAEAQLVLAQAVDEHVEAYSDAKMRAARAKAEIKFQRARRDVGQAEGPYAAAGGEDVPNDMLVEDQEFVPEMGPTEIETEAPEDPRSSNKPQRPSTKPSNGSSRRRRRPKGPRAKPWTPSRNSRFFDGTRAGFGSPFFVGVSPHRGERLR